MRALLVPVLALSLAVAPAASAAPDPVRRTPVVQAVERVAPAVVSINIERLVDDPFRSPFAPRITTGEGSGVVIDPDGTVLTNAHVVEGAQRILATFSDGRRFEATILGFEPQLDLAVLRLESASGLVAAPIGTSADLMLGEPVIAIGNPLGLGHTVTTGVVSAVRRPLETDRRVYQDFIQTDASINPGNSGGPLLNAHGELIGINTAIRPDAQNIGFAIPVDRAVKVANDLVTFGTVQVPWLGVDLTDVRLDRRGATAPRIERVWPGSNGQEAGLLPGDVIVEVEGRHVSGRADLNAYLASYAPGRVLDVGFIRDGFRRDVEVRSARLPDSVVDVVLAEVLGVTLGDRDGVVVLHITTHGAFARAGLQPGDRITALNGQPVRSLDDLEKALSRAKSGHRTGALFTVVRGRAAGRVTLPI